MKACVCIFAVLLLFSLTGVSTAQSQTQDIEGYTVFSGALGPQVCVGKWTPSKDPVMPGVCDGQVIGLGQLAAVSARLSVDKLDKVLSVLNSIDQKLAVNNDQIFMLLKATANPPVSVEQKLKQVGDLLRAAISQMFEKLPDEIMSDDLVNKEIISLEENILKEVEKQYSKQPAP
ncbi:MAG: hypothetical protein HY880_07375 [Deltaproteobacteria bacterium]|nr:hypothetical protein [Deltaproteobacteria bacterium]